MMYGYICIFEKRRIIFRSFASRQNEKVEIESDGATSGTRVLGKKFEALDLNIATLVPIISIELSTFIRARGMSRTNSSDFLFPTCLSLMDKVHFLVKVQLESCSEITTGHERFMI